MGIDLLDFMFRIEKRFGVQSRLLNSEKLPSRSPFDVTAGELHDWVVQACIEQGIVVPPSSWNRVRLALAETVRRSPATIHRDTWVVRDLDFS